MIKETVISLKAAKFTDVYSMDEIMQFFDMRHITYQIRDGVTICDEHGEALVNQETGEPVCVKRLIVFEIPSIQIILDAAKNEETGEDVYHVVVVSDVDDKLYPVTLDTVFEAVMKTHNDRLMPYYLMDASVASPTKDGWYMCICENGSINNYRFSTNYPSGWLKENKINPGYYENIDSPVVQWLIPSSAIKMADTLTNNRKLYLRNGLEGEYFAVNPQTYDTLLEFMLEGDDQNDAK